MAPEDPEVFKQGPKFWANFTGRMMILKSAPPPCSSSSTKKEGEISCRSFLVTSWRKAGRCWETPKPEKKTIGQQINNYVQNPKSYRSAFGFFEVFAGTFLLSKTGFPVKLPSFNSWKLRGSPSVWHGNRDKMSAKAPTATSLSLNFRMGTVHEKTPSANIFFEDCIESTWQWPCPVWQEPMEILLNSVRLLVLASQSHPKCKSQQKSTKEYTILYLKMWWTSLPGMLGQQSCIQPCLTNLLCSCNWMANNEFSGRRIHIPHHPTASVHFSPSWMSFIFWLDDMLV